MQLNSSLYVPTNEKISSCKKSNHHFARINHANHNTWGGVLYSDGKLYTSRRYDITHIVDRVGGGDSFMGGLIYG
jgi:sugar/nucleoside kinase (ribokinase family)